MWTDRRTDNGVEHNKLRVKATHRAYRRLAKLHSDDYYRLLNEERVDVGLAPVYRPGFPQ